MKLAPRMIQSMEILQMHAMALEEHIEQELSNNPTLELREPGADRAELQAERVQEERDASENERELVVNDNDTSQKDDFERLTNMAEEYKESFQNDFETGESFRRSYDGGERDAKMDAMANTASRPQSLVDQLIEQWIMVEADAQTKKLGEFLLGFIDADGYIRTDDQTLLAQAPPNVTLEQIQKTITLLQQTLEPVGLGARDLRQCLLIQIDARAAQPDSEDLTTERALVSDYLKDIEVNRLPRIAKALDKPVEEINSSIRNLRQFHPRPGRLLFSESPHAIRPDAVVEYDEDQDCYTAHLVNARGGNVQISQRYLKLVRDQQVEKSTREFIGNNLRTARWLLDALVQRNHTLLRVINVVIEAQREYFEQGPSALKPLPMTLVADQLGIHVATVSRAVSEKYLQTPRGIVPLRMFFSGGTETEAGDQMSWTAVQAKLKEFIDDEDKAKPLNDDELVEKLKDAGIEIARRTVAKYRKELDIPPARQRKQF